MEPAALTLYSWRFSRMTPDVTDVFDGVVNFDAIEDIQILLDYRYWTRFR